MSKDLYSVLGVAKGATEKEIKSAYRKLALQWHPDKHKGEKGAETKFKEINQAYEILSDKSKKQRYDTFGSAGGPGMGGGAGGGGFDFSGFNTQGGAQGFADIFESFFGGGGGGGGGGRQGRRRSSSSRGNDIEAAIEISFNEAVFGCEKELEITKAAVCKHCEGKGAEPGSSIVTCTTCSGTGEIRSIKNTILGQMSTSRACDMCMGEGRVPDKKCKTCHGTTRERAKERVKVKIPAGVDNGSTIRLSGKGEGGIKGGPAGDLYINLHVAASRTFMRHGANIHNVLEIPLVQSVLGGEAKVDTIHGKEKIKIPAGTEEGKVFKLNGKGTTKLGSGEKGDHLVKIKLVVPKKLSKREKELYLELAKEQGIDVSKGGLFW
jgi:molecular chaperone DnaJ